MSMNTPIDEAEEYVHRLDSLELRIPNADVRRTIQEAMDLVQRLQNISSARQLREGIRGYDKIELLRNVERVKLLIKSMKVVKT